MQVGLFVSMLESYCGEVLFQKYFMVVVMLLKCVGEFRVRLLYFVRLLVFMQGVLEFGMFGFIVLVMVEIVGMVCRWVL